MSSEITAEMTDQAFRLSQAARDRIARETAKYPVGKERSAALAALVIAQGEAGWLSPAVLAEVGAVLNMPVIQLQELATFYSMFNLKPVGKFKITVCTNLPCDFSGAGAAARHLRSRLGIDFGETTGDGLFTLIAGECMGSCGDGPVLLVNDKRMHMRMNPEKIDRLLEELKA